MSEKCPNKEFFSGPYFPVFSPNTEKYRPEKTVFGYFSRRDSSMENASGCRYIRISVWSYDCNGSKSTVTCHYEIVQRF